VPEGKVLIVGAMKAGKSTLINGLIGEDVVLTGASHRTTLGPSKYGGGKLPTPWVRVTIVDSMSFEIKQMAKSLSSSIGYVERSSTRLDPGRHVCVGLLCINGAARKYEDIDGDLVVRFRDANLPIVIVITQAYNENAEQLERKVGNDPMFTGCSVVLVNSRVAKNRRGKVIEEAFGLDILAQQLERSVVQGRLQAKPNALKAIELLRTRISGYEKRVTLSKSKRLDDSNKRDILKSLLEDDQIWSEIQTAVNELTKHEDQLVLQIVEVRQKLDVIDISVKADAGGLIGQESAIWKLIRTIESFDHLIRSSCLKVWKSEHIARETIFNRTRITEIQGTISDLRQTFVQKKGGDPIPLDISWIPADHQKEQNDLQAIIDEMTKKIDDKRDICSKIDNLQLSIQVLQDEGDLLMKLQSLSRSLQSCLVVVEQTESRCDRALTKREQAFTKRADARL
jgi:GTPase SAR1 family protein